MKTTVKTGMFLLILLAVFVLAACGSSGRSPEAAVATVDTDAITEVVLRDVQARLSEPGATTATPVDVDGIAAAVLEQVKSDLEAEPQTIPVMNVAADTVVDGMQQVLTSLYQRANPSVVYIIVPPLGSGSGFVYSNDGYIVTNNHVVENGRSYEVVFANGERRQAELVGADPDSDLAVIRVGDLPDGVEPLPLAPAGSLQVGQFVVAIGNPFGEQGSMSLGIVSGLNRSLRSQRATSLNDSYSLPEVVQTDAPINPGNSGGPLLNLDGEVVGVNSAIASTTGMNSGVGFSIPVAAVRQIVPSLIEDGRYSYPYLGVGVDDEISLEDQQTYGLRQTQGTYVVSVTPGSPADDAGLIAANSDTGRGGDLIVAIDGQPVSDFSDLNSYLVFHTSVGQTIELTVLRDGETTTLPLTLAERP